MDISDEEISVSILNYFDSTQSVFARQPLLTGVFHTTV